MSTTPVFTSATYIPGKLTARWTATPPGTGFTGYVVTLTTNGTPETFPSQTTSVFTLNRTLDAASTYTLQVAMQITGQPSVPSAVITLIVQAPTLTQVNNNGTKVTYRWSAAGGAGVGGYFAGLNSSATNWTNQTAANVLTTTFTQALASAGACTAWVRACSSDGVVLGPSSTVLTVITQAPALTRINNTGAVVVYAWTAAAGGGVDGYLATLTSPATNWTNQTNAQTLTTRFNQSLSGQASCTGWVRAVGSSNVVLGPATATRTLITEAPTLTSINNNGAKVVYRWTAAGGAGVQGYVARLSSPFTDWNQSTGASTLQATFNQALAGLGTCTGWVRGSSTDGVVLGPTTQVRTVITEAPTMTLIDNGGAQVAYSWQAAGGSGVGGYVATLTTPPTTYSNATAADVLTTAFNTALAGLGTCQGWVRGTSADSIVLGPATPALTLITQASAVTSLAYDVGALGVIWTPASTGATGYSATVAQTGQATQTYPIGASGSGTAAVTLAPGGVYQVAVRGTAPNLVGPPGTTLQPLTTTATAVNLRATSPSGFKIAWAADTDARVTGYIAEFVADGQSQGTSGVTASPATFSGTIASDVIYQGRVRSTAPNLQGPWTTLVNGPYLSTQVPTYDALGRLTNLTWDAGASVAYTLDAFGDIQTITWQAPP
ncbi:hypothetical protein [Caulobacter mirabilis]|uniref:Fibronectin type-III domain-containing protein n=1 Tax=Caulobacter mirabilis TaxID=69666 RepID=A0A2D2AWM6_9CAUL|nr:hypothetical protein [Caulobacter mirabilis]ATQ42409.1 hypothetical protein CSW64_08270 [Caulobacter mirabilis]